MHDLSTTLVAVATPPGRGGIGCLRLSGAQAESIARSLFRPRAAGARAQASHGPVFGRFVDRQGHVLDHGFLVVFEGRTSFTGEPAAELWTHGSPAVLSELVEAAATRGAVPAGPGEFTYRALRNGRVDLARAEAVRDLIEARTLYQARVAFSQAEGALTRRLQPLQDRLKEWIARTEAAVEFVEESETYLPGGALSAALSAVRQECDRLLAGFRCGRLVREGAGLAILGAPNVGKSSLFNRLLERERAIVTEVAGTTRDTLEEAIQIDGVPLRLIDTAGLRDTTDPVESEGVRRARQAREEADLELLVLDATRPLTPLERNALDEVSQAATAERTVVVLNKCDLPVAIDEEPPPGALRVSALTGVGIEELRATLRRRLLGHAVLEDPILTNRRHAIQLERTTAALDDAATAAANGLSEELVLEDLRQAMHHLGGITGEFGTDELYERIFSTFCIGK